MRNVVRAMQESAPDGKVEYAVTEAGWRELRRITDAPIHAVSPSSARRLAIDLPRVVRQRDVDAVFVTYTVPLTRRPVVTVVHDVASWHEQATEWLPLRTRLQYRLTVGASSRLAKHVLALTQVAKQDLVEKVGVPEHRVSVVGAAVDCELGEVLATTPRRRQGGDFRVLSVGNVLPRKNLLVLAQAVRACRQAGVDMELRIAGSVPDSAQPIARRIRDLLGPHVHMTGYVEPAQLAAEYKDADVLGFPSRMEGFGMPVIEAMAAGIPVVASDASCLPEVAGDAALLCGPDDVASWASALRRLETEPALRNELRVRGAHRAARFSWPDTARIVLDRLRDAARGT